MEIKGTINKYPRLSLSKLLDAVRGYSIVSFDIFDTLIKRDVYQEHDVFDLVEKKYNSTHKDNITNFRNLRVEAERFTREKCEKEEISLKDIYSSIVKLNKKYATKIEILKTLEEETECEICHQNFAIKQVYDFCLSQGKCIYIITDMYLSKVTIERILEKNGYTGYKKLYLSSEVGFQKRTGNLFKYVLDSENIERKSIIHIGDNKKSDWLAAKKIGFSTLNIAKICTYLKYKEIGDSIESKTLWAFINNRIPYIQGQNKAIGYELYGPLLYSFVSWLKNNIDPNKTVLFFSRDCQVVKKAYEIISGNKDNSVYFYGSRKSLLVPALYVDSSLENLCRLIKSESWSFTVKGLLMKMGLNPENYCEILKQYSLNLDSILIRDHLMEDDSFVQFYRAIQDEIRNNSKQAYIGFIKYFESLNCTYDFQVVDIGWRCTMQYCLNNVLNKNHDIYGFYLGVREDAFVDKDNYIGQLLNGEDDFEKKVLLASMTALIEIFFSALHGSVEKYDINGMPVFSEHECVDDLNSTQLIRDLHEGALQFVTDFNTSFFADLINISIEESFEGIKKLGTKPKKDELKAFGEFPFHMGVGVVKAAAPGTLSGYVLHPRKLLYDLSNSNWKIAFLKKLLKIKLPYYKIFKVIYKHKN